MSAHGLCHCAACADMAAFLARAAAREETHRLTEAERRRDAGEVPFCDCCHCVAIDLCVARDTLNGRPLPSSSAYTGGVAVVLRALVAQELVDRVVAWCEAEVSP